MKSFELTSTQILATLLVSDAYQDRIDAMIAAPQKDAYEIFHKEVEVLKNIAVKAGADPSEVKEAMMHIDDSFDCVDVGLTLYYHGFVDALKLMGQSVSIDELRGCIKEIREKGRIPVLSNKEIDLEKAY